MKKYTVVSTLKVRTRTGTVKELTPGENIRLFDDMAGPLLEAGRIKALVPFLDLDGSVVIPFESDRRYHWWRGGQSIEETEREMRQWVH